MSIIIFVMLEFLDALEPLCDIHPNFVVTKV